MPRLELNVLYEDNHLLVVNKPCGLPTMGVAGEPTLHTMAADYIRQKYNKPGNVYVGIVSRLDRVTSGVIVLARTSKAAARLSAQFADRNEAGGSKNDVQKTYLAIVAGHIDAASGTWTHPVVKDESAQRMVVRKNDPNAKNAILRYTVIDETADTSTLRIELVTGRKHQIRLQCSAQGHPILGDRKYGSPDLWPDGIALHSHKLTLRHPTLATPMTWTASPPQAFQCKTGERRRG